MPDNVDQELFYKEQKAKGVKVRSRHRGVYFNISSNRPYWLVRVVKAKYTKRFPFTKRGEELAAEAYRKIKEAGPYDGIR